MTLYWIGSLVLLLAVVPAVLMLLHGVLAEARGIVPSVERIACVANAASCDLDATALLLTTQQQVITTVESVAELGSALAIVLDDAR